jgi:hypothetical protein
MVMANEHCRTITRNRGAENLGHAQHRAIDRALVTVSFILINIHKAALHLPLSNLP